MSTTNTFLNTSKQNNYFTWTRTDDFYSTYSYKKLLNWLNDEFNLYLQEESEGLKVYFPNGWFNCEKIKSNEGMPEVRIVIKSKCQKCGNNIKAQLESVVNHFNTFI